jgi:hypothetical protein
MTNMEGTTLLWNVVQYAHIDMTFAYVSLFSNFRYWLHVVDVHTTLAFCRVGEPKMWLLISSRQNGDQLMRRCPHQCSSKCKHFVYRHRPSSGIDSVVLAMRHLWICYKDWLHRFLDLLFWSLEKFNCTNCGISGQPTVYQVNLKPLFNHSWRYYSPQTWSAIWSYTQLLKRTWHSRLPHAI